MAVMKLLIKVTAQHVTTFEQVFCRNIITFGLSTLVHIKNRHNIRVPQRVHFLLFIRCFIGYIGVVLLFYASRNANQSDVAILTNTTPVWVLLVSMVLLREKPQWFDLVSLLISLIGVYFAFLPSFESNYLPMLGAVMVSVLSGICYPILNMLKGDLRPATVVFYFSGFCALCTGVILCITGFSSGIFQCFPALIGIGGFSAIGQYTLTVAYQMTEVSKISIYSYSGIIFSMLLGVVFLNEDITINALAGGCLVIGGAVLTFFCQHRENRKSP